MNSLVSKQALENAYHRHKADALRQRALDDYNRRNACITAPRCLCQALADLAALAALVVLL